MPDQNLENITDLTAVSPADLMDFHEQITGFMTDASNAINMPVQWAFRGQPKTYGTLAPSFQRVFSGKKSVPAAQLIESNLIEAFRKHYEQLPEKTNSMPIPSRIKDGMDLHCLSVMQHYGVPTRLLDWTSDFWIAVYFACAGNPNEDAELWYYDRQMFNLQGNWQPGLDSLRNGSVLSSEPVILPFRGLDLLIEFDPRLTPRMRQQQAHHTLSTELFEDHSSLFFKMLKEYEGQSINVRGLRRIIISKGCKEKTLRFLDEHHAINASSIFPDVEGLGKFLHWQLDSLLTTLL